MLQQAQAGHEASRERLYSMLHAELMGLARSQLAGTRELSCNPAVLVNEAYLRMSAAAPEVARNRSAFFAYAARAMRSVLIDAHRARATDKRGSGLAPLTLNTSALGRIQPVEDFTRLDDAMAVLQAVDERCHQVVELRYFGGLSEEEVAQHLGISLPTVKRDWRKARAFLLEQLR